MTTFNVQQQPEASIQIKTPRILMYMNEETAHAAKQKTVHASRECTS